MKGALTLAGKEFRDILRERSILLAFLVQLLVAGFSTFLTVGLVGLYDPEAAPSRLRSDVAYVGPGGFDAYLKDSRHIQVQNQTLNEALEQFREGRLAAIVEETYGDTNGTRTVTILLPQGEIRTTVLVTQLKDLLRDYERDLRYERAGRLEQPVVYVDTKASAQTYFGFAHSVLLPLLVITPAFLAGAIVGDSFTQELGTRTMSLLRASPLTISGIVVGKLLTPVLLVPAQVILWIFLLRFNGVYVAHAPWILLMATALGLLLASASIALAFLVRREAPTQAAYTLLVLLLMAASLLLPPDPLNVLARLSADAANARIFLQVGAYGLVALASLALAQALAAWRLHAESA